MNKKGHNFKGGKIIKAGNVAIYNPEHPNGYSSPYVLEHRLVAEKTLGKILPPGAVVHHVDGNKLNNKSSNLVICQSQAYHILIHQRLRAIRSCGNANYKKCRYCKEYDDPLNMTTYVVDDRIYRSYHIECYRNYWRKTQREWRKRKRKNIV